MVMSVNAFVRKAFHPFEFKVDGSDGKVNHRKLCQKISHKQDHVSFKTLRALSVTVSILI